jgi:pyruvate formate lyase activating enzyme
MYKARKNEARCSHCMICEQYVVCAASRLFSEDCTGCGACEIACPREAIELIEVDDQAPISIMVNDERFQVPNGITVKDALSLCGFRVGKNPDCDIFTPCEAGACYCCVVVINNIVQPSCITPVTKEMDIKTALPNEYIPKRVVSGFSPHMVGGVGTPYILKNSPYFIEAASFHHGCLFRCPQCQNHVIAYTGNMDLLTPYDVAHSLVEVCRTSGVNRIAYSGGESTLNKEFLLKCLQETRNLDPSAHLHVDTNGALLTPDYIEDLVASGMTDIGIDLKAARIDTFMEITGVTEELAKYYGNNAWDAVRYLVDNHRDDLFLGVGIPYNRSHISLDEIQVMGDGLANIDPDLQVCVLDYRPMFRRMDILQPTRSEMLAVKQTLNNAGLNIVIVQTGEGHIGP